MHFNPAGDTRLAAPIHCTTALLAGESQNVGKLFSPADICHNIPTWETPAKCSESLHSQNCTKSFCPQFAQYLQRKKTPTFQHVVQNNCTISNHITQQYTSIAATLWKWIRLVSKGIKMNYAITSGLSLNKSSGVQEKVLNWGYFFIRINLEMWFCNNNNFNFFS